MPTQSPNLISPSLKQHKPLGNPGELIPVQVSDIFKTHKIEFYGMGKGDERPLYLSNAGNMLNAVYHSRDDQNRLIYTDHTVVESIFAVHRHIKHRLFNVILVQRRSCIALSNLKTTWAVARSEAYYILEEVLGAVYYLYKNNIHVIPSDEFILFSMEGKVTLGISLSIVSRSRKLTVVSELVDCTYTF